MDWFQDPQHAGAAQAISAVIQVFFGVGLLVFSYVAYRVSSNAAGVASRQRLDSTMPVVVFKPRKGPDDDHEYFVVIEAVNQGPGVALDVWIVWSPIGGFELHHFPQPNVLGAGDSVEFWLRGSILPLMLDLPGAGEERTNEATGEAFMRLGAIHAYYRDIHGRHIESVAQAEIAFLVVKDLDTQSAIPRLSGKRMDRPWSEVGPRCVQTVFTPPI